MGLSCEWIVLAGLHGVDPPGNNCLVRRPRGICDPARTASSNRALSSAEEPPVCFSAMPPATALLRSPPSPTTAMARTGAGYPEFLQQTAFMNRFVDRLFHAWTAVDDLTELEYRFAALYTDPVRVNGSDMTLIDLVARARSLHTAFSNLRAEVLQVVECTDSLAVAFVMHGWHTGPYESPFGTIQPTGFDVQIRTIDVLTFADERISSIWVNADDLGTLRQLGWRP